MHTAEPENVKLLHRLFEHSRPFCFRKRHISLVLKLLDLASLIVISDPAFERDARPGTSVSQGPFKSNRVDYDRTKAEAHAKVVAQRNAPVFSRLRREE